MQNPLQNREAFTEAEQAFAEETQAAPLAKRAKLLRQASEQEELPKGESVAVLGEKDLELLGKLLACANHGHAAILTEEQAAQMPITLRLLSCSMTNFVLARALRESILRDMEQKASQG